MYATTTTASCFSGVPLRRITAVEWYIVTDIPIWMCDHCKNLKLHWLYVLGVTVTTSRSVLGLTRDRADFMNLDMILDSNRDNNARHGNQKKKTFFFPKNIRWKVCIRRHRMMGPALLSRNWVFSRALGFCREMLKVSHCRYSAESIGC